MKSTTTFLITTVLLMAQFDSVSNHANAADLSTYCPSHQSDPNCIKYYNAQKNIADQQQQKSQQQLVQNQLQTELSTLNNTIQQTQNSINKLNTQISETSKNIDEVTVQINTKTEEITAEKAKLEDALSNMYIENENYSPLLTLTQDSISSSISIQQDYLAIENSILEKAKEIETLKSQLEQQRTDLQKRQNNLQVMQNAQVQQKSNLGAQIETKDQLLTQTYSSIDQINQTISRYQALLIEALSNIKNIPDTVSSAFASGDLVIDNHASWHYYQEGQSWSGMYMANGVRFGDYGCFITSVAMVATYLLGSSIDPGQLLNKLKSVGAIDGSGYLYSGKVDEALGGRMGVTRYKSTVNWTLINNNLKNGNPVILGVVGDSHFIVINGINSNGTYKVQDPYPWSFRKGYHASDVSSMAIPYTE